MGLYLAIFDVDEEIEGVEIGLYSDFNHFRDTVVNELESSNAGSKYPTLILHSDCDGTWEPAEASALEKELKDIFLNFEKLPPVPLISEWQKDISKSLGIKPKNLSECFFDVDGEPLIDRLLNLCRVSLKYNLPIVFQ